MTQQLTDSQLKEKLLKNPKKYIGTLLSDNNDNLYIIKGVTEAGIEAVPLKRVTGVGA